MARAFATVHWAAPRVGQSAWRGRTLDSGDANGLESSASATLGTPASRRHVGVSLPAAQEGTTGGRSNKGQKERISPIWPETAELLAALLRRHPRQADESLFVNRYGEPLTASGFRFRLRQYVKGAAGQTPTLSRKRITPHVFRHSTAVGLLAAGVDVTVIQSWLGHAHLDTTSLYAQASLEMKRKALEQVDSKLRPAKPPRWKRDADLLAWLDSL